MAAKAHGHVHSVCQPQECSVVVRSVAMLTYTRVLTCTQPMNAENAITVRFPIRRLSLFSLDEVGGQSTQTAHSVCHSQECSVMACSASMLTYTRVLTTFLVDDLQLASRSKARDVGDV